MFWQRRPKASYRCVCDSGSQLSIGSKRKHEIKHLLYDYLTKGQGDADAILGLIQFAIQVEPKWASALLAKYAKYGEARQYGVIGALRNASE